MGSPREARRREAGLDLFGSLDMVDYYVHSASKNSNNLSSFKNCERENRKLRHQLEEVRDRARKLSEQQSQLAQGEVGRMRAQTDAASRELLELRHSHGRLRKVTAMSIAFVFFYLRKIHSPSVYCRRMRIAGRK